MINTAVSSEELLAWYLDAGVDVALLDQPVDRFVETASKKAEKAEGTGKKQLTISAQKNTQKNQTTPQSPLSEPARQVIPDAQAVANAKECARAASTLKELRLAIEGFEGCNLKFSARSTVFSDGNEQAKLMLIGKAPGRDEDAQGLPFVGAIRQLLEKMLAAIGLDRTQVYLAGSVPWATPGNRPPSVPETDICLPFIERHIELAAPQIIMLMGGAASSMLLNSKKDIMSLRGKWTEIEVGDLSIPALPTLHPDYLLKAPAHKKLAWKDLLSVKARLNELNTANTT